MATVKPADEAPTPSRKQRAAATRQRMMDAAYRVFSARGYAKTTMEAIAAEAGVAVQTVYFTFHAKAAVLQAAYEYAVLGAERTPPHRMDWWRAADAESDIGRAVAHIVVGSVVVFERAAPLVWAVHGDEDARPTYEFNENLRRSGYAQLIAILVRKQRLRRGLTRRRARDIMLTLLGPQVYFLFTTELGWTTQQYAAWAKGALLRELFSPASHDA
jgi:AcrR family transcriptional regulator